MSTVVTSPPYLSSRAKCREIGPEAFMPERGDKDGAAAAKAICRVCPDYTACNLWALYGVPPDTDGIIGGTTARDRSRHRAEMKRRAKAEEAAAKATVEATAPESAPVTAEAA